MAEEDLLWGKNRHLFGGIEPSNMRRFTVLYTAGENVINAELPNDTIIDGQTLCTVAGAIIRKSTERYPIDEFDGELVANITSSGRIIDSAITISAGYYYAAFPYSTQGVYNRNPINRDSVNIPGDAEKFAVKSQYDYATGTPSIAISVMLPNSAVGAIIRRSTERYPINEGDGEECLSILESGEYIDTDVVMGEVYYYSIFTYSEVGIYNRDISNAVQIRCSMYNYLFGYDLDMDDPDPSTRVTYPNDVDNAMFKAAFMNYAKNEFDYGDWPSTPGKDFMPRPCMLSYDGTVTEYLDANDYTKQSDGIHNSSVSDFTFGGSAMMEWPKIYTKREYVDGVYKFRCSDTKLGDDWDCWCNYDGNDNVIDNFYTSIYMGTYEDVSKGTDLRSMSGKNILTTEQITTFRSRTVYAGASGDVAYLTWDIGLMSDYLLIRDLLVMMAKTTDCQKAYGNGRGKGNAAIATTGTLNTKGLFWGSDSWTEGVKVFGMENWWGNYAQHIAGWNYINKKHYMKITKGTHDGATAYGTSASEKRTAFGPDYTSYQIFSTNTADGTNGGYINNMMGTYTENTTLQFGLIPCGTGGSSTTFECDTFKWGTSTSSSTQYSYTIGGTYITSVENGPFAAVAVSDIELPSNTGAFLSYKPLATQ